MSADERTSRQLLDMKENAFPTATIELELEFEPVDGVFDDDARTSDDLIFIICVKAAEFSDEMGLFYL